MPSRWKRSGFGVPIRALALAAVVVAAPPRGARAQEDRNRGAGDWNDPRVLDLVRRSGELRRSNASDPDLRSYAADARGYVYFFFARSDTSEAVLVKADQVALDVWWRAPGLTRQTIKGLRDEKLLPTSIRYHLDHLTVIQDDFGDLIRLGDGDEVSSVLHPTAPGAETVYDYRLADSLTISYATGAGEIRVYEIRVRPRNMDRPGFIGSLYLDRDRAAIVRMNFSFTPASYVDPYLDYIRVSLDNSLWNERWWLPWHQEIEIRRETPFLDLSAGSVIRGRFDIRNYDFERELPAAAFVGRTVRYVSPAEQAAFPFERGLFDDLEESGGLRTPPAIEEVEQQVSEIAGDQVTSGLNALRLHGRGLSDFARYDRAEGLFVGAGATIQALAPVTVRATAGYAFGRRRPSGSLTVDAAHPPARGWTPSLQLTFDALRDMGGRPGSTLLENTISSAAGQRDYLDPYFARGAALVLRHTGSAGTSIALRFEEQRGARDVVSDGPDTGFRPVRSIDEGMLGELEVRTGIGVPGNGRLRMSASVGRLEELDFATVDGEASWPFGERRTGWHGLASVAGGAVSAGAPAQKAWLLGGRTTLLGHPYRLFEGRLYWLARGEVTIPVRPPWLGIRTFVALGSTDLAGWTPPAGWEGRDSYGLRGTVGLGLSIGWDALRFDVGRAVWGRGWEAMISLAPEFQGWM